MELFLNDAKILHILFKASDLVSGIAIADYLNNSLKTVKKQIGSLNYLCMENGCEIVSKVGSGYQILIHDKEKYLSFRDYVEEKYQNRFFFNDAQAERMHYIIRKFLVSKSIYINDLAFECSVSESTIRRDMSDIRKRLEEYNLYLVNRTNKGMSLEGNEWHIRLAYLHEEFIYLFFHKVYFTEKEDRFEGMMLIDNRYLEMIVTQIRNCLYRNGYRMSYASLMRFTKLTILTFNRKAEAANVVAPQKVMDTDIRLERKIMEEIQTTVPVFMGMTLQEEEMILLCAYMKCERQLLYHEFTELANSRYIMSLAVGFVEKLKKENDLNGVDTGRLYRDLCVELNMVINRALVDFHIPHVLTHQYRRDGLANLDFCVSLYYYLRENGVLADPYDVAGMYHVFSRMSSSIAQAKKISILVVSTLGYFPSASIADMCNHYSSSESVEYVAMEYMALKEVDMKKYAGILTNVKSLKDEYPDMPLQQLRFFRDASTVQRITDQFLLSDESFFSIFKESDLIVTDRIRKEEDIYTYVRSVLPVDENRAAAFTEECRRRNAVFGGERINNAYLMSFNSNVLNETVLKIIYLDRPVQTAFGTVNKVIVFSPGDILSLKKDSMVRRIGKLLRSYDTVLSGDRQKDYEKLCSVMGVN